MKETGHTVILSGNGIALLGTQIFRMIFGGFLMGFDLFWYNDPDSALSVFMIYVLIAIFTAMFLLNKKYGLIGLIALSIFFIIASSAYIVFFLTQTTIDPSLHDPIANWWASLLNYLFPLLTLVFAGKVYRET